MLRRYTFWLWLTIVMQILISIAHSLSFVVTPTPGNETERQLIELMTNYHADLGNGFHRSMQQLFTALSACFPLLFMLGALNNIYMLRKHLDATVIKGFLAIQLIIFGVCFGVMSMLTFLPPIAMSGLVFLFLAVSFFLIPKEENFTRA